MKYKLAAIIIALTFVGCGRGPEGRPGKDAFGYIGPQGPAGQNGQDGAQGPAGAAAVLEVIDPCGDAPDVVDEVILRLANGQLLASFSQNASGLNTRFAVITQGSYVTTDGSNCAFSVDANGNVN